MKIALIIGTRPNYIKMLSVYENLKNNQECLIVHTGQHSDKNMKDIFFEELNLPNIDINLNIGFGTETWQLGQIIIKLEEEIIGKNIDLIIVFGDVTSTLAGALVANKMKIKLAHVESGLRSNDLSMPEEINRKLVDQISDYLFVTEQSGLVNLEKENIQGNIFYVGNTMIDTLVKFRDIIEKRNYYQHLNLLSKEYIVITLHRQNNVDNKNKLEEIILKFNIISEKYKIIWVIHPRIKKMMLNMNISERIILSDPLGYLDFMNLVLNCRCLVTDSGGVTEESSYLSIPCVTLRYNTERPSTLIENGGSNKLVCIDNLEEEIENIGEFDCKIDLWDGLSGNRIGEIINII